MTTLRSVKVQGKSEIWVETVRKYVLFPDAALMGFDEGRRFGAHYGPCPRVWRTRFGRRTSDVVQGGDSSRRRSSQFITSKTPMIG